MPAPAARRSSSGPCAASSILFAVTTEAPCSSAGCTQSRAGVDAADDFDDDVGSAGEQFVDVSRSR